jgi:hypothetical protein
MDTVQGPGFWASGSPSVCVTSRRIFGISFRLPSLTPPVHRPDRDTNFYSFRHCCHDDVHGRCRAPDTSFRFSFCVGEHALWNEEQTENQQMPKIIDSQRL